MRLSGIRLAVALLAAAVVSSCGGGGSGPSGAVPAAGADYFPVDAGSRWVYVTTGAAVPTIVSRSGTQMVDGQTGHVFITVDGFDGSTWNDVIVVSESGVRDYAPAGADPLSLALSGIPLMVFPIEVGASYPQADVTLDSGFDFDGDGRSDLVRFQSTLTVVGFESISTPAGTFPGALHQRQVVVETVFSSSGLPPVEAMLEVDSWYADGVGLVKSSTSVSADGSRTTSTETLTGYRVGSRSSDRVAPTVMAVTPAAAGVMRAVGASVSATLSEAIDPQSVNASTFVVTDGSNVIVPGTTEVAGNYIRFTPAQPWASGAYGVRMTTGIRDLVGNPLAADRSWTFTVDASGPGVVRITPAAGAVDVPLDTSVVVVFDEAPDPATVSAATVQLTSAGGVVPASLSLVGAALTLTPTAPLAPSTLYTLSMSGVADRAGNPVEAELHRFQTTQGRFAYPVQIGSPPLGPLVIHAIGDVNGDGIADLLVATTGTGDPVRDGLFVLKGLPDGTLAPAAKVDVGTGARCSITSIAIGDLNGDGRPDVALGGNYCGVQVLHQAADGALVVAEFLDRVTSAVIAIADIDGSGRNALIGVGGGLGSATIWRQDGTGTLGFSQSVPIGSGYGRDVAIGDVDGDGLPDIVVAQASGLAGQDIVVLLQQAGGIFAAPSYLSTGAVWGAAAIAIADLNGDGRQDVVASTGGNSPTFIAVYYQSASGRLGTATPIPTYDIPAAVRIGDIDGDGRPDIVVFHTGWNAVGIYLQRADGTLAPEVRFEARYGGSMPGEMAVGDIDRDGRPDIVAAGWIIRQLPPPPASMGVVGASRAASLAAVRAMKRAAAAGAGR